MPFTAQSACRGQLTLEDADEKLQVVAIGGADVVQAQLLKQRGS